MVTLSHLFERQKGPYRLLIVEDVQGQIHHWHATSDKHLGVIKEEDNEIYAVDFHASGEKFATSGADSKVSVW